ncbi:MAG: hypothetical protein LBS50_09855 [Prevotellaceae bacterium]|jgi:hypothetical protein|nr:hypothetical protein [Prevotellaceae bacterium]
MKEHYFKTIILTGLILLLCKIDVFAQQTEYKRCLDGVARWSMFGLGVSDGDVVSTDIYVVGDTVINNTAYKKMYSWFCSNPYSNDEYWQNNSLQNFDYYTNGLNYYFIRESEDASQMFLYNSLNDEEFLFSDMNLEVGDVISYYING